MPKVQLAEVLLGLAMPPERAAASAGDLVETSPTNIALFAAVARTVASSLMRQIVRTPQKAVVGVLQYVRFGIAYLLALQLPLYMIVWWLVEPMVPEDIGRIWAIVRPLFWACSIIAAVHTGMLISRRVAGGSLLAWLGMCGFQWVVPMWPTTPVQITPLHPVLLPLILAGILWEHYRRSMNVSAEVMG